jgi:hypothetical protein
MTGPGPLLTLEPLIAAVRDGVERAGWTLSGLQKTTSHEFEGRWAGDSTRSAYLFFHRNEGGSSVDVFLDETTRGLQGNLALVVELLGIEDLPDLTEVVAELAALADAHLPGGYRAPVSLRLRLPDARVAQDGRDGAPLTASVTDALELEARVKLSIPAAALEAGGSAVSALATATMRSFERLVDDPRARALVATGT